MMMSGRKLAPQVRCVTKSPSSIPNAGDISPQSPFEIMRQRNCKSAAFSLGERYPSIRPPVSRCSHSQTLEWMDESLERDGCFDPERKDDAVKFWQGSPPEPTLSYYGIGNTQLDGPQVKRFNRALRSSLKYASKVKRVRRPKVQSPPLAVPMKPPQPTALCQPYILNVQALQAELQRMPTVREKLRPSEAFSALFCQTPIDPKDPLGVNEARRKAREMEKTLDIQKPSKQEARSKHWYCPPTCGEPENKCTDYEWAKYKLDSRSQDKAFQREFMEQTVVPPEPEPQNYEELYERLEACFEAKLDPECLAMAQCCPELFMPEGGAGGDGDDDGGADNQGDGGDGDADQDGDRDKDKNKTGDKNKNKDDDADKDKDKDNDKDKDKDTDKDKDKDKDEDNDKDKEDRDKDKKKKKEAPPEPEKEIRLPRDIGKDLRLTDDSTTGPFGPSKGTSDGLNDGKGPGESLITSGDDKRKRRGGKKSKKDKKTCPPCPCYPCCICNVLYAKPVEDKPFMKALLREQKEREARDYLRIMRRREYLKCATPTYKAPLDHVDPITCDDSIYRVPKVTECCQCLYALQRLQRLMEKHPLPMGNPEVYLLLKDLRSRVARRLCEAMNEA